MIARGIAGFVLVPMFGFLGACVANPLAWLFADLFLIPAYLYVMRRVEDFFAGKQGAAVSGLVIPEQRSGNLLEASLHRIS